MHKKLLMRNGRKKINERKKKKRSRKRKRGSERRRRRRRRWHRHKHQLSNSNSRHKRNQSVQGWEVACPLWVRREASGSASQTVSCRTG
jgi:hypothetical protein